MKKSKELDDNNPTKNERKDPKTIAMLVKDGRYIEPYIPESIYKKPRTAMDSRWRLVKNFQLSGTVSAGGYASIILNSPRYLRIGRGRLHC